MRPLLHARRVDIDTPDGRPLVRNLNLQMGRERAAVVGRNGVGKSTLLRVLAGQDAPTRGHVEQTPRLQWVPQEPPAAPASRGERRRAALTRALAEDPDLLLLDEPSEGLDTAGRRALLRTLCGWRRGLLVVSHDPEVLRTFQHFWSISEAGCTLFSGSYDAWLAHERQTQDRATAQAIRARSHLARREAHHDRVARRRARKKAVGRLHELDRNQSKSRLNTRKSLAQIGQARITARQEARRTADRQWVHALEDALARPLALDLAVPAPHSRPQPAITVDGVPLPDGTSSLALRTQRILLAGPNGSGKTRWLRTLLGEQSPPTGRIRIEPASIGVIAQGATNWVRPDSLVEVLQRTLPLPRVAQHVLAHRFPIGLAERPLASLSPGERIRAALIALFAGRPEVLVLDEPTASLDPLAREALLAGLTEWRGGVLLASHDAEVQALAFDAVWRL